MLTATSPAVPLKLRKRDKIRLKMATGGKATQALLIATAPRETKPLVVALQQEKSKGADIKPLVDQMLLVVKS
jgi:hypothetical protein